MNNRISIHICTKDRPTEFALLLQSLRTQEDCAPWDLVIIDESQTPLTQSSFVMKLLERIKLEGHKVKMVHNPISLGVCNARNLAIKHDAYKNKYTARLDDDSILEDDCLYELWWPLESNDFDLVGGLIPVIYQPEITRNIKHIKNKIINEHILNDKGELIKNADECAFGYDDYDVVPTHQFRTYCMYKSKIHKKVKYPKHLSNVGFREEGWFSFKSIIAGYKLGINTGAVAYHVLCGIGGCRDKLYAQKVQSDDKLFRDWIKKIYNKHGDFLSEYNKMVNKK